MKHGQLSEDKFVVKISNKTCQEIKKIDAYNHNNQDCIRKWHNYIEWVMDYLSNRSIAFDYANRYTKFPNGTIFLNDFDLGIGYTIKEDKYTGRLYVYIFMLNFKLDEFGLKSPYITEHNNTKTQYNNMKQIIRLTEGDLHRIVKGCVKNALNELDARTYASYSLGRDLQAKGFRPLSKAAQRKLSRRAKDYESDFGNKKDERWWRYKLLRDEGEEGKQMAIDAWNKKYGEPHRFITDRNGDYVITSEYRGPIDNAYDANFFGVQRDYYPKLDMIGTTTQCGWAKDCNKPNSANTYQRFEPADDSQYKDVRVAKQMANPNPNVHYKKGVGWSSQALHYGVPSHFNL